MDYRTQTLRAKFADLHRAYDHAAEPSMDSRNVDDLIQMHDTEERLDDEDDFDYEKLNTAIMDIDMGKEEEGDLFDLCFLPGRRAAVSLSFLPASLSCVFPAVCLLCAHRAAALS